MAAAGAEARERPEYAGRGGKSVSAPVAATPAPAAASATPAPATPAFAPAPRVRARPSVGAAGWTLLVLRKLVMSGLFFAIVLATAALLYGLAAGGAALAGLIGPGWAPLGEAAGNTLGILLIFVMVLATLLTLADRKWSALMQDRIGPNRARIPGIPLALKGIPHIGADVLKMLFKEDFEPGRGSRLLFNLGPLLAFAPAFILFAVVPMGPPATLFGHTVRLQIASPDFGLLWVFAVASIAVFGVSLAGWSSNNKLALLGGLRASAQMVSYEVTLGMTLVGLLIAFSTLRLEEMVAAQEGMVLGALPAWGFLLQPVGLLLYFGAASAEIKRTPFDMPEGESEIIGFFLEYSGLKFGLFYIAEYIEVVVFSGILTAAFFGGWHIPWLPDARVVSALGPFLGPAALAGVFILKVVFFCWVNILIRFTLPRFRYDHVMKLGWKMMLPLSLVNVVVTAGVALMGAGLENLAWMGLVEWGAVLALLLTASLGAQETAAPAAAHGQSGGGH
jgi:NADH-quinone oxidoreductase subunit H